MDSHFLRGVVMAMVVVVVDGCAGGLGNPTIALSTHILAQEYVLKATNLLTTNIIIIIGSQARTQPKSQFTTDRNGMDI